MVVGPGRASARSPFHPVVGPEGEALVHDRHVDVQPLRVVIAEDSALIREGLARLITDSVGVVVAKVGDGPSFVDAVVEHRPDVSVVDVRMPPTQRDSSASTLS